MLEDNHSILAKIAQVEAAIAQSEAILRDQERRLQSASSNYTSGVVGIILGAVLLFLFLPCGIPLLLAGFLAYITGVVKKRETTNYMRTVEEHIAKLRGERAALQQQLAYMQQPTGCNSLQEVTTAPQTDKWEQVRDWS